MQPASWDLRKLQAGWHVCGVAFAALRKLFGSESETDKFFAVEAHNHRFSGGAAAFDESLRESMCWITNSISPSAESH
jgi:hypothetical protein